MAELDDDSVFFDQLRWRLSNINPNAPMPSTQLPRDFSGEGLLAADVVELEAQITDWRAISDSYRELAQVCLEAAARHYANAIKLTRENRALRELL